MMDLPDEVQLEVLGWVPPHDLAATLPLVCRRWHTLARDLALWQRLHCRLLGPAAASAEGDDDGEEGGEEEGDDGGEARASAVLAGLQRGLVWMPRQDKYHEIKREKELWALEKEKWKTRLLWAASEGYPAPVQQSLVELERLAMQPVPRGPLPRLAVRPPDQPLPRFTAKDHGPPIYRPWLGEPGSEPAAWYQQIDLLDHMGKAARMAAQCGHADVVRLLLDRGAELNLDLFCHGLRHGSLELAGLVLDRAPESLRRDSELALELAVRLAECAYTPTLDLLLERHFITQHIYDVALARGLAKAVDHNDIALASALLPAGASANATTAGLHKPLLFKAVAKGIDMVKLLLDYGAAPSVEFTGGRSYLRTPLDRAVSRGAVPIVELLLKRGAEPKVHEDMPRFTGQGINDCLTLIQRAKRQSFVDSLRC
jgi:hypothetical protein